MGRGSSRCGRHKCCPSRRESAVAARESSFLGNRVRGASREEGSVWAPGEAGCGSGGDGSGCGKGRGCGTAACGEPGRVRPRRRAGRRGRGERSEELRGCPAPGWGGPPHCFVAGRKPPASALRRNGGCGQGGRLAPSRRGRALRRVPHLGRLGLSAARGARRGGCGDRHRLSPSERRAGGNGRRNYRADRVPAEAELRRPRCCADRGLGGVAGG